ncbi:chlorohydrolase [Streptococcus pneumoniae]|nr:chlorohydrolase [Streptococcus pneumoniae]
MKIKEQTRKLAAGCSKYSFEVADKTDEVSHINNPWRRGSSLLTFSKSIKYRNRE